MACSKACASSCTSSQGMPSTSTRKASISRWRLTICLATSEPCSAKWMRLRSSRVIRPSSTSRRTISVTLGCETPIARARFACVGSMPASSNQ